jgi:serine/threonine-protein kinase RsbW
MENSKLIYTFKSDLSAVKSVVCEIMSFIRTHIPDISEAHAFELKLVFNELLLNSVIHGNGLDVRRNVDIVLEIDRDQVSASVRDEGQGYDYAHMIRQMDSDNNWTAENGRGLKLVSGLTDQITFNAAGSAITFSKRVLHDG